MTYLVGTSGGGLSSVNGDTGPAATVNFPSIYSSTGNTANSEGFLGGAPISTKRVTVSGGVPLAVLSADGTGGLMGLVDSTVDFANSFAFAVSNLAASGGTVGLEWGYLFFNDSTARAQTGFQATNFGGIVEGNLFSGISSGGTVGNGIGISLAGNYTTVGTFVGSGTSSLNIVNIGNQGGGVSANSVLQVQNDGTVTSGGVGYFYNTSALSSVDYGVLSVRNETTGTIAGSGVISIGNDNITEGAALISFAQNGTGADILFTSMAADPSALSAGSFFYNHTSGALKYYNGAVSKIVDVANKTVTVEVGTRGLTSDETGHVFTNEGDADGSVHNLPTAMAGLSYTFCVQAAQTVTINAAAGDQIQVAASTSSVAGSVASSTAGDVITLTAINATEWFATSVVGAGWATA